MKGLLLLFAYFLCRTLCLSQTIDNPVFDRSDVPAFYIKKVEITKDTTYIFCSYYAEAGYWASISKNTYLRDSESHRTFPLQRCIGLPYSPEKRQFSQNESCELLFCFPSIAGTEQFDFIENEYERAFNIYGVSLKKEIKTSYTDAELKQISDMVSAYDSSNDTEKSFLLKDYATSLNNLVSYNASIGNFAETIRLGTIEMEIREHVFGPNDSSYIESLGNLAKYYANFGNYTEAIRLGMEEIKIREKIFGLEDSNYVTSLENLVSYNTELRNFDEAIQLQIKLTNIKKKIFGDDHIEYAYSIATLASLYSDLDNNIEAIRKETEAMEILKRNLGIDHPNYIISLDRLAYYNIEVGNYQEAIRIETEAAERIKKVFGSEESYYVNSLEKLASYNAELSNFDEAVRLQLELTNIKKKIGGTDNLEYEGSLARLAFYNYKLRKYSEAIKLGTEAMEILKRIHETQSLDYALSLSYLANYYSDFGNDYKAIPLGIEALELYKRLQGSNHHNYVQALKNLAYYNSKIGNYKEAIKYRTKIILLLKDVTGTENLDYAKTLTDLAYNFTKVGNYTEALRLGMESLKIIKKIVGKDNIDYANSISQLADLNSVLGNYTEAIRLEDEAMDLFIKILGPEHPRVATSLCNLSIYYSYLGNYAEAIRLQKEAIDNFKKNLGTNNENYVISMNNLADCYYDIGNYSEAIKLGVEAMELHKKVFGIEHPLFANSIANLSKYYSSVGNYTEAIRLGLEAREIYKKTLGKEHINYATSLNNLVSAYFELRNYSEALKLGIEATEIFKKILGKDHNDYVISISNLASVYCDLGNYNEAIRLGIEATEIRKKILGIEHPRYAISLHNLANYYSFAGNFNEAIKLENYAKEILEKNIGTEHPNYILSLKSLAIYYSNIGNYIESFNYLQQCLSISKLIVLRDLTELSSHTRGIMWKENYASSYNILFPYIVSKYQAKQSISELYDKTCLFAKGILLNTDVEMRKLILESDDSVIIEKYNALSSNIRIYNSLIEKPIKERFVNVDSLYRVIEKQEMVLAKESKVYGDYTRNLTITWKDVQRNLDNDDIAIEFLDYPLAGTDSLMYIVLTLKKEYDCPHMITLFEANQLNSIPKDVYYTQTDISNLIWKPLEDELRGVKNIYFAPSGELHRIGIEYLPISKTKNISDEYTLYRLSSTRQIAVISDETKGKNNILYGGLDYDEKSDVILIDSASVKDPVLRSAFSRANVDSLSLRGSYEFLEGTKKEADMIAKEMKQHNVPYVYYSGIDGTEESFKHLDGTRPKVMHIATHGFFLTEEEAGKTKFNRPEIELLTEGFQKVGRPVEDKSMTRSGLLFSGCNHAVNHEQIPDGEEDGILTAKEISMLDLRGLDLVVLSACQTGLGDIISGEGVFGLQRGFKKAGANTILMSLDKVDDEATKILMVEFYKNLMSGRTKYQSLKDAQKYLRSVENGRYDDPKYWASFIMLDGLN